MATDVIIEPGSGQIYWNDSAGSPQSISIKGDAQNTISVVGYSGAFSPGSSAGGTFVIASFNDNSGTSAFVPGTTNYDLGSTIYRWSVYGYTGNFSSDVVISPGTVSTSTTTGALQVRGGIGVTGNAYIGGTTNVTNLTAATGVSSAALVVSGGLGVVGDVFVAANANSKLSVMQSSGDEGGEIFLNKPVTNSSINTGVTIDVFQNRLRIFEQGGSARGFYLDITTGGNGVATNIMGGSSSGTVNTGAATFAAYYASSTNAVSENANLQFTGSGVSVGGNITATSTTTGSLQVRGGFAITGNAFIGGTTTITDTTTSNSTATGALVIAGGLGVGGQINSASLVTSGNAVISGNLQFNGNGTFGNATSDTVNYLARAVSNFVPSADATYDLGLNSLGWRNGFIQYLTGTAITATNFYGTLTGNVTGTATTAQNINIVSGSTGVFYPLFTSASTTASGIAVSINGSNLSYNFATNVLSASIFSGNFTGTAATATNFYGTLVGNSSTATTATNVNVNATTINATHYITFSPASSGSGLATSTDIDLSYNPATNVFTAGVFSGNLSGTAATVTNFYGTLTGNVTGTATTAQSINTVAANTNATHYLAFSPTNGGSGVALSTDANLTFNSLTNVLTSSVFSGNLSATAATSGLFAVGNLTYSAANLLAVFQSSVNSYNQVIVQNSNNGAAASVDFVVNNDISTDSGAYGNFGMNSSGFTGSGSTNIPNAVYVTSTTAELVVGTTTNNRIRFVNENVDTFQITATGSSVYTTTATLSKNSGAFVVAGGAAIGLSLSVGQGIHLYNSTNGNFTGFKAGATSSNSVYTMPLAYPSTGSSILQSDNAGTLIWVPMTGGGGSPGGSIGDIQLNSGSSTFTSLSSSYLNVSTTTGAFKHIGYNVTGTSNSATVNAMLVGVEGLSTFSGSVKGTVLALDNTSGNGVTYNFIDAQFYNGTPSQKSVFSVDYLGNITHADMIITGSNYTGTRFANRIRTSTSQSANNTYILPLALPGTGASFLQCDTSGNMSWVNSPGGGSGSPSGSPKQIQYNNNGSFGGAGGFEYITVGGSAVTVSMFSVAGGGYTSGLWVNVLSASSTKVGIGLSNPQFELEINGELSATNKSFVIDHPTKPGMKLRYGSLEGPENGVYVRGELKNSNIITVPDHWVGLVYEDSYTVHLTPIGRYSQLYVEKIENYNVYIADSAMNPIHCYYSIWAERKDIPKLVTEY